MKYIKLYEHWQGFNKEEKDADEKEYTVTIDKLLTWAEGPHWREDWEWMSDILMIDEEFPEEEEYIGYLELLKKNRDLEVLVYSQNLDGQITSDWSVEGVEFSLITWEWPFEEEDLLDELEQETVLRLAEELGDSRLELIGANRADLIDFVSWAAERGEDLKLLSPTGFENWFELQRGGAN
jgi:hypothetical protein